VTGTLPLSRTDDQLVSAFLSGEQAAFTELMERHENRIYALAWRLMGNRQDALDATQEVFLQLLRKLDRYDSRSAFSTWLYRVATNVCYDLLRRRRRQPGVSLDAEPPAIEDPRAEEPFTSVELRPELSRALGELSEEFRSVVVLHDIEQLRYSDIAEVLSIPVGTVKSRLSRGRHELAELLRNLSPDPNRPT
jgi:RNA polymerase sigma-70 factor (ECF subfamily)